MSSRARVQLIVAGVAVAAAALVVVGAVLQGRGESTGEASQPPAPRRPPLDLGVIDEPPSLGRQLSEAERSWNAGKQTIAARAFTRLAREHPDLLAAAVGRAVTSGPNGAVGRLRSLSAAHPDSSLALLNLGLALYAAGERTAAMAAWRAAQRVDPDSSAAVHAASLLHPEIAPGLPQFTPPTPFPHGLSGRDPSALLAALRHRAEADGPDAWLLLGAYLQQLQRPLSARAAFDRAAALAPQDPAALTAAAVGRFDKDNPSLSFSRLGPLARDHPRSQVVRYHLGLMLLWIRQVGEARRQLRLAVAANPHGLYGREANALLGRLAGVRTN